MISETPLRRSSRRATSEKTRESEQLYAERKRETEQRRRRRSVIRQKPTVEAKTPNDVATKSNVSDSVSELESMLSGMTITPKKSNTSGRK